jgi:hypothetical protein
MDQTTCLSALTETLQHEEIVMLETSGEPICPAKQHFIPRIISFNNLIDLRQKLFGGATDTEIAPSTVTEDHDPAPQAGVQSASAPQDEQNNHPKPEGDNTPIDRRVQAAQRMQLWWRRHVEREYFMATSDLSRENECYQRFSPLICKLMVGTSKRDRLLRKILRGPGLLVILALETLSEQLEELLYAARNDLQAFGIDGNAINIIQKRQKLVGYVFISYTVCLIRG